jgi:DNA-binding NtrC family response regulator
MKEEKKMKGMKVLLVDDEIEFVNTLSDRLGMRGIKTDVVYDGDQALDYVAKSEPDVIVLDLEMPKVHGMDVLRQLSKTNPDLQVVILTAFGSKAREEEAKRLKAFDFLNKPVDVETLADRIRGAYSYKIEKTMAAAAFAEAGEFETAKEIAKEAKRFKTTGEGFKDEEE